MFFVVVLFFLTHIADLTHICPMFVPCLFQRGLPVLVVPDVGHPAPGGGEGLPGAQRHRLGVGTPGGQALAGEDLPSEDPIQKSIRDQGGIRTVRCQSGGEACQG